MTYTDYMCQEKKEEEDSPALKTTSIHGEDDSKIISKKSKERLITATREKEGSIEKQ